MGSHILKKITVLEMNGLAPVQFCGQILSDFGARVIRIDKVEGHNYGEDLHGNGKLSVAINLKTPEGIDVLKRLSSYTDVIIEPFRAGVMENLGLGPEVLLKENKRLIYARLSGYGQSGNLSQKAGHDINFLSLSGVQSLLGWRNKSPDPPCNLLGDFAGGSLLCTLGIMLALYEREKSGLGQVIDHSILRGTSYLASWMYNAKPFFNPEPRGHNLLDGGHYAYDVYETKDKKWMAVGAVEKKFYDQALVGLNLTEEECPFFCQSGREIFSKKFKEKTQAEWIEIFKSLDACVTPVLTVEEAANERREDYVLSYGGDVVGRTEPKFSRSETTSSVTLPSPNHGQHTSQVLAMAGYTPKQIEHLSQLNAIYAPHLAKL